MRDPSVQPCSPDRIGGEADGTPGASGENDLNYVRSIILAIGLAAILATFAFGQPAAPQPAAATAGSWIAGDFHQHSYFTDGSHVIPEVISNGFAYGLGWQANSEHGGSRPQDGNNHFWDDKAIYPVNPILGDFKTSTVDGVAHQSMWRWQSVRYYAFPLIQQLRAQYPGKLIASGLEWNMPGHEHCSTGIAAHDASGMAQFEWLFDASDSDVTGGAAQGWSGKNLTNDHAKAVQAAVWMHQYYKSKAWMVPAHPERAAAYKISDFRDLNNAAPSVAFGFEGMPGHQKEIPRGSYSPKAVGGGTYGGAGYYIARVGGLWDALLGEGRHWWTFVSSDFHDTFGDFWPGEYAKTWTLVKDLNRDGSYSLEQVVAGLRSGNSFSVHGDLIQGLNFQVRTPFATATMGDDLKVARGNNVNVVIRFRSPAANNHGDAVKVDHIDLIAGQITGRISPADPSYTKETNDTTKVIATFTAKDWATAADGWNQVVYQVKDLANNTYFRLRGTNLAPNTPNETDAMGNPLPDSMVTDPDGTAAAWRDLWFYSNPIFVYVQ